jgi:hypothetical protein
MFLKHLKQSWVNTRRKCFKIVFIVILRERSDRRISTFVKCEILRFAQNDKDFKKFL